ncbi:MAG: hypothetical protein Q7R39_13400 [Dehalococcoidia bacterium]|nr:hypothetical protein [Dehalococcoidia bacterium]
MPARQPGFGLTPEDMELRRKKAELQDLEALLAESELELATLRAELQAFERRYLHAVWGRMRQLDELEDALAELQARRAPDDFLLKVKAQRAKTRAERSTREAGETPEDGQAFDAPSAPSNDFKTLYRELAKKVHPDLATTPQEGERRTRTMAEVNAAYAVGDEAKLTRMLAEWRQSPDAVEGDGAGAELVRVIRQIAQVQRRIGEIDIELQEQNSSAAYNLWAEAQAVKAAGAPDLIGEMARRLDRRIDEAKAQLAAERGALPPMTG